MVAGADVAAADASYTPLLIEFTKIGVGIFAGFLIGRYLERFKFLQAELTARVDDVCELIRELCDLGDDYWREIGNTERAQKLAGKINGLHFGLNGALARLGPWRLHENERLIGDAFFRFSDTLTGGDFGVGLRKADTLRASNLWRHGAALQNALRRGRAARYTLWPS